MSKFLFISAKDGIHKLIFDGQKYVEKSKFKMDSPMYTVVDQNYLHVLLRSPFGNRKSGYLRFTINENGDLINPTQKLSTMGECACHLCVVGDSVYAVNYGEGSVINLPENIKYLGDKSRPHFVGETPDKKFLFVTDLGLNKIYIFQKDLSLESSFDMPNGAGVRHLVVNGNIIFTTNELDCTVSALKYSNGELEFLHTVKCAKNADIHDFPSAIRIYNGAIFVAVRGKNIISKLTFNKGKISLDSEFSCGGEIPRDFIFDENRLICCNQGSDTVTVFNQINQELVYLQTISVKAPMCATVV